MGYRHHGVDTGGLPVDYIKRFINVHPIPIFIETGTAGGESIRAAAPLFRECHTIEIVEGRPDGEFPDNVTLHHGDSSKIIGNLILGHKNEYIFFWLDAHWSEPHESPSDTIECPLLDEIRAIRWQKKSVIMIDDARLFLAPPKWPCDYTRWPRFSAVFNTLQSAFPDHYITVIDDYIVCIPDEMKEILRYEWWENQDKRFPSEEQKKMNAIRTAWHETQRFLNSL